MSQNLRASGTNSRSHSGHEPTLEAWAAFRRSRDQGDPFPLLGTAAYHFRDPGPTRICWAEAADQALVVDFEDGRRIAVPWSWFPILWDALPEERAAIEIWPNLVRFPKLFTEVTTSQLLRFHDAELEADHIVHCAAPERRVADAVALLAQEVARRGRDQFDAVLAEVAEGLRRQRF